MKSHLAYDLITLAFIGFALYSMSYTNLNITLKSPSYQRNQSYLFPKNFTEIQKPLYPRFIYLILDGVTYDYADSRIQDIPGSEPGCEIHTHQIPIFNEMLNQNPSSVVFQRLQIEQPPKTELKIETFLKGTNPTVFSMKIPKADPYKVDQEDSILYQLGQSDIQTRNYGFLTYYLYNYIGYHLTRNQFALDPYIGSYESQKQSEYQKMAEYHSLIEQKDYDTLFIYAGLFDEVTHAEGMHTQNVLDAQKECDKIIRGIIEKMDDEAVLIVTSDHGKSEDGSHLNCIDSEFKVCNSLLFAYTKQGFIQDDTFIQSIRREESDQRISSQAGQYSAHESMITSTIANLLNIPIPFLNSGRTLFEVYPSSKFANRVEMLQRVLQDSFATLEQQKQFYQQIQTETNIYDAESFQEIIDQVEAIENKLFYEQRDRIIYSEQQLEQIITEIVDLQDLIQDSIYSTEFYSIGLLFFGAVIGGLVSAKIIGQYFIEYKMKLNLKTILKFIFILASTGLSILIQFISNKDITRYYGLILAGLLVFYMGLKVIKNQSKAFLLLIYLGLNISITVASLYDGLLIVSSICEMLIFILHTRKVIDSQKESRNNQIFMYVSLLFASVEVILRVQSLTQYCFAVNLIFYIFSLQIQNRINSKFFKQGSFQIDLILINIFWCFLGLFSNYSYLVKCSKYYPIVIVSLYLLCEVISIRKSLYNSFYLQLHIIAVASILYMQFHFQTAYQQKDFNILLIILYYFPLPIFSQYFKNQVGKIQNIVKVEIDREISPSASQDSEGVKVNGLSPQLELPDIEVAKINFSKSDTQEAVVASTPNTQTIDKIVQEKCKQKRKSGIYLQCFVLVLSCCIYELLIIREKNTYNQRDISNEYILISLFTLLVSDIIFN